MNKPGDMKHLNQVITQPPTQVIGYGVWPTEWEKGMVLIELFWELFFNFENYFFKKKFISLKLARYSV